MLTPQEIQDATFTKAVFGGYDMKSVDDFLDQMSTDYVALYTENTNLKTKLRLLVQKIEEYRAKEATLNQATAQAASIIAEAEQKAASIQQTANIPQPPVVPDRSAELAEMLAAEEQRVENAKRIAQNFINAIEEAVGKHTDLLEELKKLDPSSAEKSRKAYDYESEADPETTPSDFAREISENIERFYTADGNATDATKVRLPDSNPVKPSAEPVPRFSDLQFGPNYDPRA